MDSGFYAACTALMARSQALDLVANNLANVSTPGFRGQQDVFRSLLAGSSVFPMSGLNQAVNNYSVLGDSHLDLTLACPVVSPAYVIRVRGRTHPS